MISRFITGGSLTRLQAITNAVHGDEMLPFGRAIVQLPPQRRHRLVNGAGQHSTLVIPHAPQQLIATENRAGVLVEEGEEFKFLPAQTMRAARVLRRATA